jgi:hypothetical protein
MCTEGDKELYCVAKDSTWEERNKNLRNDKKHYSNMQKI